MQTFSDLSEEVKKYYELKQELQNLRKGLEILKEMETPKPPRYYFRMMEAKIKMVRHMANEIGRKSDAQVRFDLRQEYRETGCLPIDEDRYPEGSRERMIFNDECLEIIRESLNGS